MEPLTCAEVEKSLWRYVDRELSAADLAAVSGHLDSCAACRSIYHEHAQDAHLCRVALGEAAFTGTANGSDVAARITNAMEEAGLLPPHTDTGETDEGPTDGGRRSSLGSLSVSVRLAAGLLVAATVVISGWILSGDFSTSPVGVSHVEE